ncbi:MAG TPA: helix-turn-helix domain-containing protein [Kofleriaceae bacterium]|nr:helix-turn-helix domain-containing protein [Kofleriaceae bacterium]
MATARRLVRRAIRKAKPRVRLDNDERRAQLLVLACRVFSDRSYDEVSIDDLAREAKISKGLLYHYFPTKRDLYVAALRVIADELVARVYAIPQELPPADRVRAGIDAYLDHITLHARAFVALMRGGIGSDPEVAQVIETVRRQLSDQFLDGSPFAPLLANNARFAIAVRGWIGFVEQVSIDWCVQPRLPRDELRDLLSQILFAIIGSIAPQILRLA